MRSLLVLFSLQEYRMLGENRGKTVNCLGVDLNPDPFISLMPYGLPAKPSELNWCSKNKFSEYIIKTN